MEIGGYLEFERYGGKEYHANCLKLNTARNCLEYLIVARNIKKMWISRWNCSAIFNIRRNNGVELSFFDLDDNFKPVLPDSYVRGDFVYVVNYYGQLFGYQRDNMILDNVQAFFQRPEKNTDTIYTCRKYFGVSDGAYLYTDCTLNRELKRDESAERIQYLAGRLEKSGADYYGEFQKNEQILDGLPLMTMSMLTENILRSINYMEVKRKREENFAFLNERLESVNMMDVKCPEGPFAYPMRVKDGDRIRSILRQKKIYIAKLWPNVRDSIEKTFADDVLPLPCDQRYSIDQMRIISDEVIKCL